MSHIYAGIGSRKTPPEILSLLFKIGEGLAKSHVLRSGAANGADTAFEQGARVSGGKCEIFLPWKNFNGSASELSTVSQEALDLAATIHPAWERLGAGPRKLHARNCYQILGENLDNPVEFVVCWTSDGCESAANITRDTGGTGTAIALASLRRIKVFNLKNQRSVNDLDALLRKKGLEIPALSSSRTPLQSNLFTI